MLNFDMSLKYVLKIAEKILERKRQNIFLLIFFNTVTLLLFYLRFLLRVPQLSPKNELIYGDV